MWSNRACFPGNMNKQPISCHLILEWNIARLWLVHGSVWHVGFPIEPHPPLTSKKSTDTTISHFTIWEIIYFKILKSVKKNILSWKLITFCWFFSLFQSSWISKQLYWIRLVIFKIFLIGNISCEKNEARISLPHNTFWLHYVCSYWLAHKCIQ